MDIKNCILTRLKYPVKPLENKLTWIIGDFSSHHTGKQFTALGNIINPAPNLEYTLCNGSWKPNEYKGTVEDQFHFEYAQSEQPQDEKGIAIYLEKYIDGLGFSTIAKILNMYGLDSLDVLKNSPSRVALQIKGITKKKADKIAGKLLELEHLENIILQLESILDGVKGLPKKTSGELIDRFGVAAYDQLKLNPYYLTAIHGIGFLLADRFALEKIIIAPDSIFRQEASIEHCLKEEISRGGSWGAQEAILLQAQSLIGHDVKAGFNELIENKIVIQENDNGVIYITFNSHYENEKLIAKKAIALCNNTQENYIEYEKVGE